MAPSIDRNAHRLMIYIGESDRWRGKPLYAALLETLRMEGIAGATVVRGVAGFGAHSRIHTAAILRLSEDLPLRIEVIDSPDKIAHAIEVITPMIQEGLVTLDEVQVIKYTHRYLNPLPADRRVEEIMTREVVVINSNMNVAQAWARMLERQVKALPVVTDQGEVVGMLTDEDLLECCGGLQRLAVAKRLDEEILREELETLRTSPLKVVDVMRKPAITVKADDPLGLAAARMAQYGIKRLPVVGATGKIVGVVSRVDILEQIVDFELRARKEKIVSGAARILQDVMSPQVPMVNQDTPLADVISTFIEYDTHRVVVVDKIGRAIGLISDADAVSRVQPQERRGVLSALSRRGSTPPSNVKAGELMSSGVLSAPPDTEVIKAVRIMLEQGRAWLVVTDTEGRPLGLVDRQILLVAVSGNSS